VYPLSLLIMFASSGGEYMIPVTLKDCEIQLQQSKSVGGIMSRRTYFRQTIKFLFLLIVYLLRIDEGILNACKSGVIVIAHLGLA
jgi:hypothetical protein